MLHAIIRLGSPLTTWHCFRYNKEIVIYLNFKHVIFFLFVYWLVYVDEDIDNGHKLLQSAPGSDYSYRLSPLLVRCSSPDTRVRDHQPLRRLDQIWTSHGPVFFGASAALVLICLNHSHVSISVCSTCDDPATSVFGRFQLSWLCTVPSGLGRSCVA